MPRQKRDRVQSFSRARSSVRIERWSPEPKVRGSNPLGRIGKATAKWPFPLGQSILQTPRLFAYTNECIRSRRKERSRSGSAERTGSSVQQPEQKRKQGCHLHSCNLLTRYCCALSGRRSDGSRLRGCSSVPEPNALV